MGKCLIVGFLFICVLFAITQACDSRSNAHDVVEPGTPAQVRMPDIADASTPEQEISQIFSVSSNEAVDVAARYLNLEANQQTRLTPCAAGLLFKVIEKDRMIEVGISRRSSEVLGVTTLVDNVPDQEQFVQGYTNASQSRDAVQIAKAHFQSYAIKTFSSEGNELSDYVSEACDLGESWRILFVSNNVKEILKSGRIERLPNEDPPNYLVKKLSGEIVYFSGYDDGN